MAYKIYADNWYTSENLLKILYEQGTSAVGTVRKNRVPGNKTWMGNYIFRRNVDLVALKYQQPCIQQNPLTLGRKPGAGKALGSQRPSTNIIRKWVAWIRMMRWLGTIRASEVI